MRLRVIPAILIFVALGTATLAETTEARVAFKKGYDLFQEGKYYSSIKDFKLAIIDTSYPLLDYSYYYIAKAYHKKNNFEDALRVYEIVIKYFSDSVLAPKSLFAIAQCQNALKDYKEAASTFRKFIVQFPQHELIPEARYRLGQNLEKQGFHTDAARIYRNLDLLHPKSCFAEKALEQLDALAKKSSLAGYEASAATVYNLGVKYFKSKNYTKAKEYFTRLTRFYKKSSFYDESLLMLGRVFLRKGKINRAIKYLKKSINLNKDSKPEAMYYLARSFDYLDNKKAAIQVLKKLVSLFPHSHSADEALYYVGHFYTQLGDEEKADTAYSKLVASYPRSSFFERALWQSGNINYKKGNYQAAYENLKRTLELHPEKASERLTFWSGKFAEKMGNKKESIAAYKTTIARYDHSYYAYRAREKLKKYGIDLKPSSIPEVSTAIEEINGTLDPTSDHERKYNELLALGLADEAAEEASFLVENAPLSKKDKARIAKYHAYVMKGKFAKPIQFADKKINEAVLAGELLQLDPRLWRFAYPRGHWRYVEKYAKQYGIDPYLVYAVIREESRFRSRALSHSWAHGLMQIMPSTGRIISRQLGISYSRWKMNQPRVNIRMGTYYLASLIKRFNGNVFLALAGYNGGPVRVKRWLKQYPKFDLDEFIENIPLRETRNYVKKVMKSYYGYKRTYSGG